ncbi:MarR family winged helix-turn-helix transcriptional regulator [Clostridium sp.]|uniref:MarR family winged helix-turn-helix transcriptional regulator n=1 Tax=Clostridium sp. TaxID=1506 RepID=UPI0039F5D67D
MKRNLGCLMSILHRQSQIYINCSLKKFNISSAEYAFLMYLYKNNGATQDELSSYLYIDKSATARAIKSLEEKGYVIKNKDDLDKRYNRVYLTNKAITYKDKIREAVWGWNKLLTKDIDPAALDLILSSLEKMVNIVESTDIKKELEEL